MGDTVRATLAACGIDLDEELAKAPENVLRNLHRARELGDDNPLNARQYFEELREPLADANFAAVTGVTVETALWPVNPWSGFGANELRPGQLWRVYAFGIITTSTAPGNLTITPRYGTTTGGITFGASSAEALTASLSNIPWFLQGVMLVRSTSTPTTAGSGNIVFGGTFESKIVARDMVFGGTVITTADTTIASGLFIGVTPGATTVQITPQAVVMKSMN